MRPHEHAWQPTMVCLICDRIQKLAALEGALDSLLPVAEELLRRRRRWQDPDEDEFTDDCRRVIQSVRRAR